MTEGITCLEYMTEGVLLRKAMSCDNLSDYKVVIIDEAHERTVNADLLMGFLKQFVLKRPDDLRVIIMSATLDTERFKTYFDNPPIIQVPGSVNPVQHHYLSKPTEDYVQLSIQLIESIHQNSFECDQQTQQYIPDGHILVFLTGQSEIEAVIKGIQGNGNNRNQYGHDLEIYPLFGAMNENDRKQAFAEPSSPTTRKCVVATNIAETSLTIDNVVYVIDCGLSRQKIYSPSQGLEILSVKVISKASVKQRVGRAGRVKPGTAYHLYTKPGYVNFPNETPAEILRSGLVNEVLSMLALGISNPLKFDFIDPPDEMTMARALHILKNLNAIDDDCKITKLGHKMAKFPVNPRMAKSLVIAKEYNCIYEMIVIASMLEIEDRLWWRSKNKRGNNGNNDIKEKRKQFCHSSGDHITLLNIYNAWRGHNGDSRDFCNANCLSINQLRRVDQIKRQIERTMATVVMEDNDDYKGYNNNIYQNQKAIFKYMPTDHVDYYDNILKALLSGHFMNIAVKGFGDKYWRFRLLDLDTNGTDKAIDIIDKAKCHRNSVFHKSNSFLTSWIIYHDVSIEHCTQLKILTAIKPEWLLEIDSNFYYDINALVKDGTPISQVLKDIQSRKMGQNYHNHQNNQNNQNGHNYHNNQNDQNYFNYH